MTNVDIHGVCVLFAPSPPQVTDNMDNKLFRKTVESTGGVMEPGVVVDAFMELATNPSHLGSVLMVTKRHGARLADIDVQSKL